MSPIKEQHVANQQGKLGRPTHEAFIVASEDLILITGSTGFIGPRVVESLLRHGFRNLRCFTRPYSNVAGLEALSGHGLTGARVEVVTGNLLSPDDCSAATK